MISADKQDSKSNSQTNLPSWTHFPLDIKNLHPTSNIAWNKSVLIGHYLIIIAHDNKTQRSDQGKILPPDYQQAFLLAVDLRDNSVQQAEVPGSLFFFQEFYSFTYYYNQQYERHEIWKFGGRKDSIPINTLVQIIIKDFEPFSVNCEIIQDWKGVSPQISHHTAQIYNDCLYIYGGMDSHSSSRNDLWCFDIKAKAWKGSKRVGEDSRVGGTVYSFLIQDNLYIYGGGLNMRTISVLNLNSLKWEKLELEDSHLKKFPSNLDLKRGSDIYKGHLVILIKKDEEVSPHLACWNIDTQAWSTFDIENFHISTGSLIIYKHYLMSIHGKSLAFLNLNDINMSNMKTPEDQQIMSMFMSHKESDVTFTVEGQILPAHKGILIQKSQYFKNLFNSGMIESRQQVIEIPDCEYMVFQEFLRFLYCNEVKFDDVGLAQKLLVFAEKHLKDDLRDKCLDFLTANINLENVYPIFDFAREQDLSQLRGWCGNFCRNNIDMNSVVRLMKYIDQQSNLEFEKEYIILRDKVLDVLLNENYIKACQNDKNNLGFYEDFLLQNIEINTISSIAKFLGSMKYKELMPSDEDDLSYLEISKTSFEQETANLKNAAFIFIRENFQEIRQKSIHIQFPLEFFADFVQYLNEKLNKFENKTGGRSLATEENIKNELKDDESEGGFKGDGEKKDSCTKDKTKRG